MIVLKKWAKHKVKSYIYCVNQFLRHKNVIKNEAKNVNQNSHFCLIFVILYIYWSLELRK